MPRIPLISYLNIRLRLQGCTNRPFYEIVVMPHKKPRQGWPIEQVGTYDPLPNSRNEKLVAVNFEAIQNWIAKGAHVSRPVEQLLGLSGFFPIHPTSYLQAHRNRLNKQKAEILEEEGVTETTS